jgi:hypothetical protein
MIQSRFGSLRTVAAFLVVGLLAPMGCEPEKKPEDVTPTQTGPQAAPPPEVLKNPQGKQVKSIKERSPRPTP